MSVVWGQTRAQLAKTLHYPTADAQLMSDLAWLHRHMATNLPRNDMAAAHTVWLDSTYVKFDSVPSFPTRHRPS